VHLTGESLVPGMLCLLVIVQLFGEQVDMIGMLAVDKPSGLHAVDTVGQLIMQEHILVLSWLKGQFREVAR
jgi:hypothetical protein